METERIILMDSTGKVRKTLTCSDLGLFLDDFRLDAVEKSVSNSLPFYSDKGTLQGNDKVRFENQELVIDTPIKNKTLEDRFEKTERELEELKLALSTLNRTNTNPNPSFTLEGDPEELKKWHYKAFIENGLPQLQIHYDNTKISTFVCERETITIESKVESPPTLTQDTLTTSMSTPKKVPSLKVVKKLAKNVSVDE